MTDMNMPHELQRSQRAVVLRKERKRSVPEDLSISVWMRECECDGRALWCEECCFLEFLVNLNVTHDDRRQNRELETTLKTRGNLKGLRDMKECRQSHSQK